MPLLGVVIFFLCDVGCLFVCLRYGVCVLSAYRVHWFVLSVLLCSVIVFLFLVCIVCLWCVVLLVVVSLASRACMFCGC